MTLFEKLRRRPEKLLTSPPLTVNRPPSFRQGPPKKPIAGEFLDWTESGGDGKSNSTSSEP